MDLGEGPGVRPLLFWVSQKEEKPAGQLQNKSAPSLPSAQGLDWLIVGLLGMSETGSKLKTTREGLPWEQGQKGGFYLLTRHSLLPLPHLNSVCNCILL